MSARPRVVVDDSQSHGLNAALKVLESEHIEVLRASGPQVLVLDPVAPPQLPSFRLARPSLAARMMALALPLLGIPPQRKDYSFQRFGRAGEFAVEEIVTGKGALERCRWRLEHAGSFGDKLHKTRARAFEAAADIARARGDSINDCARLLAGVRW